MLHFMSITWYPKEESLCVLDKVRASLSLADAFILTQI